MVLTSPDEGSSWRDTPTTGEVLLIVPGAGEFANRQGYDLVSKRFVVAKRDTDTRAGGFVYPPKWGNIRLVKLDGHPSNSLVGLAKKIGDEVKAGALVPSLVLCGSRGGQIVLPMLLRHFWRDPSSA